MLCAFKHINARKQTELDEPIMGSLKKKTMYNLGCHKLVFISEHTDCFTIALFYSFFSAFLFSFRSEVSKSLEIDTILRNFTVFEYLKDKVRPSTYHAPLSLSVSKAPLRWHQHTKSVGSLVSLPSLTTLLFSFDPEVCRARS